MYRLEKKPVLVLATALLLSVPIMALELLLVKSLIQQVQMWTPAASIAPIIAEAAWLAVLLFVNNIGLGVPIPMAMTRLSELAALEEKRLILRHTARLPLAAVESPTIKDLRERAMQVSLYDLYNTGVHLLQLILQSAALIAMLLYYGQWLPVIAAGAAALVLARASGRSAQSIERLARLQTPERRLLRHYAELMTRRDAAMEVRLFGLGSLLSSRWTLLAERQSRETFRAVRSAELLKLGPELLMALLSGLLVALLVLLPGASELSAGDFALLFMALTMLLTQLPRLVGHIVSMRKLSMRWEDFRAYMKPEGDRGLIQKSLNMGSGLRPKQESVAWTGDGNGWGMSLKASGLRFRYPGAARDTIDGIDLAIPQGCRVALVGENGSGKSTLVKLLTGLYAPDEGEVIWSGSGRAEVLSSDVAEHAVSAVFQDFARLYVTLRENVALGKLSELQRDDRLRDVLQSAGSRFDDMDLQLGATFGGIEPSGGEWQKIVTARALLRDAGFVFFDEPTAALDPQAEKEAFDLFLRVTEGRSALLVTHRLGAAKLADVIWVLKDGRLAEQGTHAELIERNGEYRRMFDLQASWYV